MSTAIPSGGMSVMASRREPPDSLDYFPTPPWATRALMEHVLLLPHYRITQTAWEPAAGSGHMAEVLREYFHHVVASDVHDYGRGYHVGSFVGDGPDKIGGTTADWVITNPPFKLAAKFAIEALSIAKRGVALLTRTAWLEGGARYRALFNRRPPFIVALFSERVPMVKGRWDPKASTATSYAWVVWRNGPIQQQGGTRLMWIPPDCRKRLTKPDDVQRFARAA